MNRFQVTSTLVVLGLAVTCAGIPARCTKADELTERGKKVTIANSDRQDALSLFFAAGNAFREGRTEDAGFFFYAAEIRAGVDLQIYEPVGVGGNSPAVCLGAIRETLGTAVNPVMMRDCDTLARVVARLSKWAPAFDAGYDPGWEYKSVLPEAQRTAAVKQVKESLITHLEPLSQLLHDDAYYAAFKTVQDYNLTDRTAAEPASLRATPPNVTEPQYQAAMAKLEDIEQTRGIHTGMFSDELKRARQEQEAFRKSWVGSKSGFREKAQSGRSRENTYQVLGGSVTYESRPLTGADPATFQVLPQVAFAKDARHVHVCGHIIPNADPKTFWPLGGLYARDASAFYCGNVKMKVDDVAHFEVVRPSKETAEYWQERDFLFETGMSYESVGLSLENTPVVAVSAWARDGSAYYYGPVRVAGCDYATFQVVDGSTARDKNQEYTGAFPTDEWANRRREVLKIDGFMSR